MKCLVIVLLVGVVLSAPPENQRVKRQILPNCIDTFNNVPNPCTSNPTKRVYFPHPRDANKFIQCDVFGRMFVIQCPATENYNQATTSCIQKSAVTQTPGTGLGNNPCTPANVAKGAIYFAVADKTQFIECDLNGNANVLTCPSHLVWDQSRLSCVYNFLTGLPTGITTPNPNNLPGLAKNPCKGSQQQFYSHPDANKFIQCDIAGDAYVLSCPSGLVWNQFSLTCVSPYTLVTTNG